MSCISSNASTQWVQGPRRSFHLYLALEDKSGALSGGSALDIAFKTVQRSLPMHGEWLVFQNLAREEERAKCPDEEWPVSVARAPVDLTVSATGVMRKAMRTCLCSTMSILTSFDCV